MATITNVVLTDSLDPRISSGVETVPFYDPMTGTKREIELGEANRKHFANHLEKLAKYIEASRVVEGAKQKVAKLQGNGEQSKIREWAKANGYTVGDRGRIKAEIVEAYNKATAGEFLSSALENSAKGNVADLGDFTQFIDEMDSREHEAEVSMMEADASVALDGETQVIEGSQEVANGTDAAWEGDGPSDADILAMMAEIDTEKGNVSLDDLAAAVDNKSQDS